MSWALKLDLQKAWLLCDQLVLQILYWSKYKSIVGFTHATSPLTQALALLSPVRQLVGAGK